MNNPAADPTELRHFVIEDLLGEGASATVHAAVHRTFQGRIALKRWRQAASEDQRRKFLDECRLQWRLSEHPNIVRLYWAGAPEGQAPWLAMELYETSLADLLRQPVRPGTSQLRQIAEDFLTGLAEVHSLGHVHRDVKPANVLIKGGRAALGDLGISMPVDAWTSDRAAGTAFYVAPELGSGHAPDYRSDVYSAGRTLEAAFRGTEVMDQLEPLLTRSTSYERSDRPADAAELLRLFRVALGKDPAPVTERFPAPVPAPRRSRRAVRLVIASLAVVLLVAGGTTAAWSAGWMPHFLQAKQPAVSQQARPPVAATSLAAAPEPSSASPSPETSPSPSTLPSVTHRTSLSTAPSSAPPVKAKPTSITVVPDKPTAKPVKPTPQPSADGAACFATATTGGFDLAENTTVSGGPNYLASPCTAIHIKLTGATYRTYARSCLETSDGSSITSCSSWILLSYPDTWDTLSTPVQPGARYQLQMYALGSERADFDLTG